MSGYLAVITPGLPATISQAIRFTMRPVYGADGQFDGSVVDTATLAGQHDEALLRSSIAALERASRPGGFELATVQLAKLRAKTATRSADGGDQHLIGQAYAEELAEFPSDVIVEACRRWADGNRWWPAWADLKRECDRLSAKRLAEHRALKEALDRIITKPVPALSSPAPLPTQRERLRTSVLMRRQAGDPRKAAVYEQQLAAIEKRPVEQWAADAIAEQLAEQAARAAEWQKAADAETWASQPLSKSDAYLAEKADARRREILGIDEGHPGVGIPTTGVSAKASR